MFDDDSQSAVPFDFDELADHLLEQGADVSPAQVHGCLCGLLAAGAPTQAEYGLDALDQVLALVAHGELAGRILQLYAATAAALVDEEFAFHPLLPDDEVDIAERTAALARWCNAFLAGVAYASAAQHSQWSEQGREILEDIAAMAQADLGDDDDVDEDELEGSYTEIVEYLRFAVLNLHLERSELSPGKGDEILH